MERVGPEAGGNAHSIPFLQLAVLSRFVGSPVRNGETGCSSNPPIGV